MLAASLESNPLDPEVLAACERFARDHPKKESAAYETALKNYNLFKSDSKRALKEICKTS